MKKKIVLASGNKNKLREFREILTEYDIVSCKELGFTEEIEEDGKTFYENALIKARAITKIAKSKIIFFISNFLKVFLLKL